LPSGLTAIVALGRCFVVLECLLQTSRPTTTVMLPQMPLTPFLLVLRLVVGRGSQVRFVPSYDTSFRFGVLVRPLVMGKPLFCKLVISNPTKTSSFNTHPQNFHILATAIV